MQDKWELLGKGSYNLAFVNSLRTNVLKIQQEAEGNALDAPIRSVRLWNEINPSLPAKLYEYQGKNTKKLGWVCPFIEGRQSTDPEMRGALIDIFNATGRIIVDAISVKNFITTKSGKVTCIDIGMALQLDARESDVYGMTRKTSQLSLREWPYYIDSFQDYFQENANFTETIGTIKALLFIKTNRPDILNVDFLKSDFELTKKLATAYDAQYELTDKRIQTKEIKQAHESLNQQQQLELNKLKEHCKELLKKYIKSRGSLDLTGIFSPSIKTKIFRDERITAQKVEAAKSLMGNIDQSNSIQELRDSIKKVMSDPVLTQAKRVSGFNRTLGICNKMIETAAALNPELERSQAYSQKP